MSENNTADLVQIHICGSLCSAGGPPEWGGHKFDIPWESDDGLSSGFECKCGMDNISYSMANLP